MKQLIANILMTLGIFSLIVALTFLFHLGTGELDNEMCDKLFALCFTSGCIFALASLKLENNINKRK